MVNGKKTVMIAMQRFLYRTVPLLGFSTSLRKVRSSELGFFVVFDNIMSFDEDFDLKKDKKTRNRERFP